MAPSVVQHGQLSQPELAEVARRSTVCVLPSFYEGLPLVLVEALACGCRLVATELPGIVEELAPRLGDALTMVELPSLETGRPTPRLTTCRPLSTASRQPSRAPSTLRRSATPPRNNVRGTGPLQLGNSLQPGRDGLEIAGLNQSRLFSVGRPRTARSPEIATGLSIKTWMPDHCGDELIAGERFVLQTELPIFFFFAPHQLARLHIEHPENAVKFRRARRVPSGTPRSPARHRVHAAG